MTLASTPRGVLLVHGAWHEGHHTWQAVAQGLRARGVPVAIAELHRGGLAEDTAAAEAALSTLASAGPAVVCGHSYGGSVITGLHPDGVAHLVYLAATMPAADETTLGQLASGPSTALMNSARPTGDGRSTVLDATLAGELMFGHSDSDERARQVAALVPQDMTAGYQHPQRVAWRTVPSTYVVTSDDHTLHPDLQRSLSARANHRIEWFSDHAAYLTRSDALVDLLLRLATQPRQGATPAR